MDTKNVLSNEKQLFLFVSGEVNINGLGYGILHYLKDSEGLILDIAVNREYIYYSDIHDLCTVTQHRY